MDSNIHQNYYPANVPLQQPHHSQAASECTVERPDLSNSLLKDVLLHGQRTVRQNYYAYSYTNTDVTLSYSATPNSQIASHNSYQVSPVEYHTSTPAISPTEYEQFFGNLERQDRQQESNKYDQNFLNRTVQSHVYASFAPGPSNTSMQYERDESRQQATFNAQQELQINSYNSNNNNNNIRQRNRNIETPNPSTRQSDAYSNNIIEYPWMHKRTNAKQENGAGQKRTRQTYTRSQIFELEKEFYSHRYLPRRYRAMLANRIILSERQVKIWFQNRRMKEKKATGSPNNSSAAVSKESKSTVPKSNTQMTHERQVLHLEQQTQLQSQSEFYQQQIIQNHFLNYSNQPVIESTPHHLNNSQDNSSYENAIARHTSFNNFVNPFNTFS